MLEALSGLFSGSSSTRTESLQAGYIGRMVQPLETQIASLIEASKVIGLAKTRLELFRIGLIHEVNTQQLLIEHEITSMQTQLQLLNTATGLEDFVACEGYFGRCIQSLQELKRIFDEKYASRVLTELVPRSFGEPKLLTLFGQLKGFLEAESLQKALQVNRVASNPPDFMSASKVMHVIEEITSRHFELLHEVLSLHAEVDRLVGEVCGLQHEIGKRVFEIWIAYIKRSTSPNVKIFQASVIRIQSLCTKLIQRMGGLATENSVDAAHLFTTVHQSGEERILLLLKELSECTTIEKLTWGRAPLELLVLNLGKFVLEEVHRLQKTIYNHAEHLQESTSEKNAFQMEIISNEYGKAYKNYIGQLPLAMAIENKEDRMAKVSFLKEEVSELRVYFESIIHAMTKTIKTTPLPEFFCIFKTNLCEEILDAFELRDPSIEDEGDESVPFLTRMMTSFGQYVSAEIHLAISSTSTAASSVPPSPPSVDSPLPSESSLQSSSSSASSSRWD